MESLAVDVLLLLLDDESGRLLVDKTRADHVVAGAVVLELIKSGRVALAGPGDEVKAQHLVVRDGSATGSAVADRVLAKLADRPVKIAKALEQLGKEARDDVAAHLVDRGLVRLEENKVWGLFRVKTWPSADAEHEAGILAALKRSLLLGNQPDEHIGSLVALLYGADVLHKIIGGDKGKLRARAAQIAQAGWADDAVRTAIHQIYAAVMATAAVAAGAAAVVAG